MLKITERLKVKILNDGILDTDESFQKAQWLIDIINRAECEHEEGRSHQILLDDKELESLQSPFPDSDLKKAIQALKNGGVDLNNLVDYEKKKRETQINKARTDLSIVGVKGNVEMRNFSPFDDSPRDIASSYITQSIANVGGSVKLTGDFAPRRRTKTTFTNKSEETKIMDYRRQSGIVLSNSQSFEKSKQKDKIKEFKKILGITSQNKTNNLEVETALPYGLAVEDRLEEDNIREGVMYYNKILPKNFLGPFNGGVKDRLPTKLINLLEINESELEEIEASKTEDLIEGGIDIEDYAILSYSWGAPPWSKFRKDSRTSKNLHDGSEKSFHKAIKACKNKEIKVDYLWMDCLCINQRDEEELAFEISKLRQYYRSAKVTLIPIQKEIDRNISLSSLQPKGDGKAEMEEVFSAALDIIKMIVRSDWFRRTWTFQEGLLSPQTVFMFDDCLVDGRFLAMVWSIKQGPETNLPHLTKKEDYLHNFFKKYSKKVATPLGWAYYEEGYNPEDEIYLSLFQALKAIERRERFIIVDGIYSVLGLLSYGSKVRPKYKENNHYTKKDFVEELVNVMKIAVENGHGEPLSWYGEGNNDLLGLCWLPKIEKDGLTSIERVIEGIECEPNSVIFTENGIKIKGSKYKIVSTERVDSNNENDDGELYSRRFLVGVESSSDYKWVNLQGTRKTLVKKNSDDFTLLVPNKNQWKNRPLIALLVKSFNDEVYHRVDLIRILEGSENLTNPEEEVVIGMNQNIQINKLEKEKKYYEAHIEVAKK